MIEAQLEADGWRCVHADLELYHRLVWVITDRGVELHQFLSGASILHKEKVIVSVRRIFLSQMFLLFNDKDQLHVGSVGGIALNWRLCTFSNKEGAQSDVRPARLHIGDFNASL